MASTMEGMLKAMENRPGSPRRFLERTLKILQKATQVEALGLADSKGEVLIDSGKSLYVFPEPTKVSPLRWVKASGIAQLRVELEVEAFNESEALVPIFSKEKKEAKRGPKMKDVEIRERMRDRFKQEFRSRFQGEGKRPPRQGHRDGGGPPRPEPMENMEVYEVLLLDVPVKQHLRSLRLDAMMRILISLSTLVAIAAILWVLRRQEHLHRAQVQLQEQEQIHKSLEEKNLAALGLAHETRTPLSVLRGHAQLNIDDSNASEEVHERSLIIVDEVDRITSRLNDFISYARQPSPELKPHNLKDLTTKVLDLLRLDLEDKNMIVEVNVESLNVMADGDMLVQVLFNLLMNAVQILPEGGRIDLTTEDQGNKIDLHVQDDGPGFPKDLGESCFQPYVTQREGGTGLGLAVVQQILNSHGASLELLESEKGAHLLIKGLQKIS